MADDNNNLDINIGVNATQAEQGSARARKAIGSIGDESKELQRSFRALKSSIDPTFQAQEKYNRSLENYKKLLDKGLVSQKEYRAGLRAAKADLDAQVASINRNSEANRKAAAEKARINQQSAEAARRIAREEAEAARQASQAKIAAAREERRIKANLEAQEQRAIRLSAQMARQAATEASKSVRRGGSTPRGIDPGSIQTQQSLKQLEANYKRTYEAAANHARKAHEAAAAAAEASNARQAASAKARAERETAAAAEYASRATSIARTIASVEGQTRQERVAAEKAAREQEKAAAREAARVATQAAKAKRDAERQAVTAVREAAVETRKLAQAERVANEAAQQMRASIDPVYASQQRYNETMRVATSLLMQNKLQQGEWIAIQRQAKAQMDINVRSMGRMNSVYVQLGYQAQDVTASLASGINPLVILAQQGGQTAAALSMMGGRVGSIASFFAGPWGAAIIGFTMLLGFLWDSMKEGETTTKSLTNAEDRRKMTIKELTQALRDYANAQEEANNTTLASKAIQAAANEESRKRILNEMEGAKARVEAAKSTLEGLKAPGAIVAVGGLAAYTAAIIAANGELILAEKQVKSLESAYGQAMKANVEATIDWANTMADTSELDKRLQNEKQALMGAARRELEAAQGDEIRTATIAGKLQKDLMALNSRYTKLKEEEAAARRENAKAAKEEAKAVWSSREEAIRALGKSLIDKGYSPRMENFGVGDRRVGAHPGMGREAHGKYAIDVNIPGAGTEADKEHYRRQMDEEVKAAVAAGYRVLWNGKIYEPATRGGKILPIPRGKHQHRDHAHIEAPREIVGQPAGTALAGSLVTQQDNYLKERHDAAVSELEFQQGLAAEDLKTVMDLQDQKIAVIKAFYGEDSSQAIDAMRQKVRYAQQEAKEQAQIKRQALDQEWGMEQQKADQSRSLQQQAAEFQAQALEFAFENGYVSQEEYYRSKAALIDQEFNDTLAHETRMFDLRMSFLRRELEVQGLTPGEIRSINQEIQKTTLDHEGRVFEIRKGFAGQTRNLQFEIMDKMEEKWRDLGQTIEQSLSQAFQNIWTHTGSFWQSMVNLADQMVYKAFINPMSEAVSDWIIKQARMLFIKKATDAAVTSSAVASQAIQTTAATTGAAAQTSASAAAATGEVTNNAAAAAAGAYKSTVVIPFIGPVAAPAAAALALAAVLGFGALISAKGGQGEVKQDGQLTQLHKKEMVLPAYIAEPLRQGLSNPSGGLFRSAGVAGTSIRNSTTNQAGDINLNYAPNNTNLDASFETLLKQDSRTLRKWIKNELRNGGLNFTRGGR